MRRKDIILLLFPLLMLSAAVSCQSETPAQKPADQPTLEVTAASTFDDLESQPETPVDTAEPTIAFDPTAAHTPLPTVTSPVPTPTSSPQATPVPTQAPSAEYYQVQPGDTLLSIAANFDVSTEALAAANGYQGTDEFSLIAGTEIQIPLCQVHQVVEGNTLAGIAQMCAVTLDELVTANITSLALLGSFDAVPVGFALYIPLESGQPADLDCLTQPAREQVIEYTPQPGEGIYCLSQKFTVSTTAILQANRQRLAAPNVYGQTAFLIPPVNGAIYEVTQADINAGITLLELALWYELAEDGIFDWNGNPIEDPLSLGQQLFLPDANLLFGIYQSPIETES